MKSLRDADRTIPSFRFGNGLKGHVPMEDKGTGRPHSEDTKSRYCVETPPEELFDACELAGQLEQLLRQEAETLRRFENQELLKILHRKESLIRELAAKMNALEEAKNGHTDTIRGPQYLSLKTCLREIEKLNRSNRAFIEGSLSHYQHFIDCLCPSSYHPHHVNEPRQELAAFKGLTFRKEI
jgi:flagellar biosynthesis/type III secretory pathway chaperone